MPNDDLPPVLIPARPGDARDPHHWPWHEPVPAGYSELVVYEDCISLLVRSDLLEDHDLAAELVTEAKRATRRSWLKWRREQAGLTVLDGGLAVRA